MIVAILKNKKCGVCNKTKKVGMDFGTRSDNGKGRNTCKVCINEQAKANLKKKNDQNKK